MLSSSRLDVVIFGASGFTGKYMVLEAIKVLENLSWGIAGRNRTKLTLILEEMGLEAGVDLSHIPIIVADVNDRASLLTMAQHCKIVVNCCGPYRLYGKAVIEACIEAGTHHVDISTEPQFLEGMQLKYHNDAENKGIYIVSACGFESIPADLGTVYLQQQFDGVVNSVESYTLIKLNGIPQLGLVHYGRWSSFVQAFGNVNEIRDILRKLQNKPLPEFQPKLNKKCFVHKSFENKWSMPLPGSDSSCVRSTQRFFYETEKKRPIQMNSYISFRSITEILLVSFVGAIVWLMLKVRIGRAMLLNYPRLFTFGMVSHEGPSESVMNRLQFEIYFEGRGWEEKLNNPEDKYLSLPNKVIRTKITGRNPCYGATCVALLLAAKTILLESEKMPGKGGCLPPGAAFAKTSLISELCKNGFKFEVVSKATETNLWISIARMLNTKLWK